MTTQQIITLDCIEALRSLPDTSVHCCVTSPPYWGLRDYGHAGQIGLEPTPEAYVARMVEVFREVRRVLRDDGTCWLNLGDSYTSTAQGTINAPQPKGSRQHADQWANRRPVTGLKPKDLVGIPWRVAFALQADGWWLRQDIIWHKPNPMPESVRDRCTKAHEYVFLLTKSERYFYDAEAVSEAVTCVRGPGNKKPLKGVEEDGPPSTRNRRSVWTITTKPYRGAHFAVMPPELAKTCILAGTSEEGCCPHCGSPWERIVEKKKSFESGSGRSGNEIAGKQDLTASETNSTPDVRRGPVVSTTTIGWQQSCKCEQHSPIPCTVLDPFSGSGTTVAVAAEIGRSGIGCELNPEYVALSHERIEKSKSKSPLFA